MEIFKKKNKNIISQEEKDLLLKDLIARLPYGVKCSYPYGVDTLQSIDLGDMSFTFDCPSDDNYYEIDGIRPYLRPLSSMTEEECNELKRLFNCDCVDIDCLEFQVGGSVDCDTFLMYYEHCAKLIDWFNKKMFDYCNLIPNDLALEAPDGMYNK